MSTSPDARAQRIETKGEQRRLDRAAELEIKRGEAQLKRQQQIVREQAKRERKHTRQQAWKTRRAAVEKALPTIGRRVMIVVPILAPMAVAWVGQISFADSTLGWPLMAAFVFAAAWELTTAFAGWMYHQARKDGDRGTVFRVATWLFAASAGAMNYWHALGNNSLTHPTPKAVSYGAMSLVGIGLWELYASLIHRKELRDRGLMPSPRPRFGAALWLVYPRLTFRAWRLSIRDRHSTVEDAWAAALSANAKARPPVTVTVVQATTHTDHLLKTTLRRPVTVTTPWGGYSAAAMTGHRALPAAVTSSAGNHVPEVISDRSSEVDETTEVIGRPTGQRKTRRPGSDRKTSTSNVDVNAEAVQAYRESVRAGKPLSQRVLAARFNRSPGWARARIRQAGIQQLGKPEEPVTDRSDDHPEMTARVTAEEATG